MAYCPNCHSVFHPGLSLRYVGDRLVRMVRSRVAGAYRRELGLTKTGRDWAIRAVEHGMWNARVLHRKWVAAPLISVND
jgi:hypothetical protein